MARGSTTSEPTIPNIQEPGDAGAPSPLSLLMAETALSVSRLARERDVDAGTVSRWVLSGVKGTPVNGVRPVVKLESYRLGGRVFTTREAFARFVARCNGELPTKSEPAAPTARTPAQRKRDSEKASRLAETMGA
jgi:hypothetical protein